MKFISIITLLFLFGSNLNYGQSLSNSDELSRKEAERLWELAIKTQGGREKLKSIQNMVVSSQSKVQYSPFKTYLHTVESLFVFPDKEWRWDDNRPSVFGLRMEMYDYKNVLRYIASPDNPNSELKPFDQKMYDPKLTKIIGFLLETYWLKPIPMNVKSGKIGSKQVDTINTMLDGVKIDFAFDQKTHLLVRLIDYYPSVDKESGQNIYDFSNYVEVNGIMMPTKLSSPGDGGVENLSYQLNVEYNEGIFKKPPSFADGPEAWKKKN